MGRMNSAADNRLALLSSYLFHVEVANHVDDDVLHSLFVGSGFFLNPFHVLLNRLRAVIFHGEIIENPTFMAGLINKQESHQSNPC